MDQRIESFLGDVLALAKCAAIFRVREPNNRKHLKLVLSVIDRQVR